MQVIRIMVEKSDDWFTATALDDVGTVLSEGDGSRMGAVRKCKRAVIERFQGETIEFTPPEDLYDGRH